ncbi:MAG TPA: hypothetical protein VE993_01040 [Stellaceae bacterium]|nr:hypothetical protein [Stellaceae bacterium]
MPANKFTLRHHQLEIDYTVGITPGLTALTYHDGPEVKTFKTTEITTEETALGTLVSVFLVRTIDTGGERFGFFLPQLDVPAGQVKEFHTVGVDWKFSGPDSRFKFPPSWRCVELHGEAQTVIVPLEHAAV